MTGFVDELLTCMQFGEDDEARLRALGPVLTPHLPTIADELCAAVAAQRGTAWTRHERLEELRVALLEWLATGLAGPHDAAFYAQRARIGGRDLEVGLANHCLFAAMNVIRTAYTSQITEQLALPDALPYLRSIDKLLDIELAVISHHHQAASECKLIEHERETQRARLAAMQTLSSGLAHEIRNPVNSAKLQLELLERRLRRQHDDRRLSHPLELVHHELERLTALVDDFLTGRCRVLEEP